MYNIYLSLHCAVHHCGKSRQELRTKTKADLEGMLLTGFLLLTCSATFFYTYLPKWPAPFHINEHSRKCPKDIPTSQSEGGNWSVGIPSFQVGSCQVETNHEDLKCLIPTRALVQLCKSVEHYFSKVQTCVATTEPIIK